MFYTYIFLSETPPYVPLILPSSIPVKKYAQFFQLKQLFAFTISLFVNGRLNGIKGY